MRRSYKLLGIAGVAVMLLCIAALAIRPATPAVAVVIEVKDEATSQPIPNAVLTAYYWRTYPVLGRIKMLPSRWRERQRTETHSATDGVLIINARRLAYPSGATFELWAEAPGYEGKTIRSFPLMWKKGETNRLSVVLGREKDKKP